MSSSDLTPSDSNTVKFKRVHPRAELPVVMSADAACYDLVACEETYLSPSCSYRTINTGIAVELPPGYVGLVCSRSGLASKEGIFVLNAPGIIDADYRGEIKVVLARMPHNLVWPDLENYLILPGFRIAQLMIIKRPQLFTIETASLSETSRGAGGFGSTGV